MNEESRPARRLPNDHPASESSRSGRQIRSSARRRETTESREHQLDRMVVAAVWRRQQARAGRGYKFKAPRLQR
jgi:hypothetical protein